ncbi:MAG: glycosyltransferase [Chitinophagales bacterium]
MNLLLLLFILCAVFQLTYLLILYLAIHRKSSPKNKNNTQASVTIIICVKDDYQILEKNLPVLLAQDYDNYDILIVDDGSAIPIKNEHKKISILRINADEKIGKGKKYALHKGIHSVTSDYVLLTDADCCPTSSNWIQEMLNCTDEEKEIVLGISPYYQHQSFLSAVITYETALTAMQYIGWAILKMPYMSVGRNVLYKTSLAQRKIWEKQELEVASGDDDLMIQSLATKENTEVCLTTDSYTYSAPQPTFTKYIQQKMRHFESGNLYALHHRLVLGGFLFTKLLFYCLMLLFTLFHLLQFGKMDMEFVLGFFGFYVVCLTSIQYFLNKRLQLIKLWIFTIFLDIFYCFFTVIIGSLSLINPTKKWK